MTAGALVGKVAIVPVGEVAAGHAPALARRLAAEGASVVLVAADDGLDAAGHLARDVEAAGAGRVAVFELGAPDETDALVELVTELLGGR